MSFNNKLFAPFTVRLFVPKSRKILFKEHSVIDDLIINPIKTPHKGKKLNYSTSHYSYILFWHNKKIFIAGDADSGYELLQKEKDIDIAIIPFWNGTYALTNNKNINAKDIILCHFYNSEHILKFRDAIKNEKVKKISSEHIELEDIGSNSIGVWAGEGGDATKLFKIRLKWESAPLASSIKMSGDPF